MSDSLPPLQYQQPLPDGRQSATALAVQRGAGRLLRQHGFAVLAEFTLPSGRRADLMAIKADGTIWIVEIKSSLEDFRVDQKWPEYRDYCDEFFFAIPAQMDAEIIPIDAGLMRADAYGAEIMRQCASPTLAGARRKALTLLFARVAAQRLHGLWDP